MSLAHAYCGLDQLRARLGLQANDGRDDEALEGLIEACSRAIDAECFSGDSQFYPVTATRYFTATCGGELVVDDLLSVSSLKTDLDGSGTFGTTWAVGDFALAPYNNQSLAQPRPYWRIERLLLGANWFPIRGRGVQITGTWGWCTDANRPKQVEIVCLREAHFAFSANTTPYGMTTGDGSAAVAPAISLSNYSKQMLAPFKRVTVA